MNDVGRAHEIFSGETNIFSIDDYKMLVATVCSYLADLNHILDESDSSECLDEERILETLGKLQEAKEMLLKVKGILDLGNDLRAFETDLNLFGAEFRGGRFKIHEGHEESFREETLTAAKMVLDCFPEKGSAFEYEAMTMCLFFCYPLEEKSIKKEENVYGEHNIRPIGRRNWWNRFLFTKRIFKVLNRAEAV